MTKAQYDKASNILNKAFKKLELSQEAFGRRVGVSHVSIGGYLNGQDRPSLETVTNIIRELRLSMEEITQLLQAWDYELFLPRVNRGYDDQEWSPLTLAHQQPEDTLRFYYQNRPHIEKELLDSLDILSKDEKLLLYGLPGVGKTSLVRMVGDRHELYRNFPGGVLLAEVGPGALPSRLYMKKWLGLLGKENVDDWSDYRLQAELARILDNRRTLIWVDGVRYASDLTSFGQKGVYVCWLVSGRFSSLASKLDHRQCPKIEVKPLGKEQSSALLKKLLPKELQSGKQVAKHLTEEVVRLSHGLPLVLELAAKAIDRLGWDRFLIRIRQPGTRLATLSLPASERPEHSLLSTLQLSYEILQPGLQDKLHQLKAVIAPGGVEPQHVTLGQIAKIWKVNETVAEDNLTELEQSLMVREINSQAYTFQPFIAELLATIEDEQRQQANAETQQIYLAQMAANQTKWEQAQEINPPPAEPLPQLGLIGPPDAWLERFAMLRISAEWARRGSVLPLLRHYLLTVEYLATCYPEAGLTWAQLAYETALDRSPLERAVMGQLYGWVLQAAGQQTESRFRLLTAATDYELINDLHGQVACRWAIQEKYMEEDKILLRQLLQEPNLTIQDAHLFLYIAKKLHSQGDILSETIYQAAEQIYQRDFPDVALKYLHRAAGEQGEEEFSAEEAEIYETWQSYIQATPYCHRQVWQTLRHYYRQPDLELRKSYWTQLVVDSDPVEIQLFQTLANYGTWLISNSPASNLPQNLSLVETMIWHLYKRALSSPAALSAMLHSRQASLQAPQDVGFSNEEKNALLKQVRDLLLDKTHVITINDEVQELRLAAMCPSRNYPAELNKVNELLHLTEALQCSTKLAALQRDIQADLEHNPKMVVFSHYRETLEYVYHHLTMRLKLPALPLIVTVHGGLSRGEQQQRIRAFEQAKVAILLATDTLSPDLPGQLKRILIYHYELPWGQERLEYRFRLLDSLSDNIFPVVPIIMKDTWESCLAKKFLDNKKPDPTEIKTALSTFNLPGAFRVLDDLT